MVRTRSEEKRREIIRVAAKAFEELGYERTSMLTIAERLRGSKQTLYNYFPVKGGFAARGARLRRGRGRRPGDARVPRREEFAQGADATRGSLSGRASSLPGDLEHANRRNPAGRVEHRRGVLPERPLRRRGSGSRMRSRRSWLKASSGAPTPGLRRCTLKAWCCRTCSNGSCSTRPSTTDPKEMEAAAKHAADAFLRIYGNEEPKPRKARG